MVLPILPPDEMNHPLAFTALPTSRDQDVLRSKSTMCDPR